MMLRMRRRVIRRLANIYLIEHLEIVPKAISTTGTFGSVFLEIVPKVFSIWQDFSREPSGHFGDRPEGFARDPWTQHPETVPKVFSI